MPIASRVYQAWVLGVALLFFGLVMLSPRVLNDGDTFMHLAAGGWMLDHHRLIDVDPFSLTAAGQRWVSHEWLSELLMALAWRTGGWAGFLALFASATAASLLLFARVVRRWLEPLPAGLMVFALAYSMLPTFLARPHLLVLPVMVAWAAAVLVARSEDRAPHPAAALLMVAWVNLHGSFLVGPAFAAAAAIEAWLDSPGRRAAVARHWGGFLLLSIAALFATPHHIAGVLLPFQLVAMPALRNISEWQPINFSGLPLPPIVLLLLGLLYLGLVYGPRLPRLRVALALVVGFQALAHARNQILFAVFVLLVLAEPLGRFWQGTEPGARLRPPAVPRLAWGVWLVAALALVAVRAAHPVRLADSETRPISALAALPPGLAAQPVLNGYNFGSYLIFRGIHPYIDGRAELYGNEFVSHYLKMAHPSHALLTEALARYHIAWTIFSAQSALADMMDLMPGWKRLYADKTAVVHVRTGD